MFIYCSFYKDNAMANYWDKYFNELKEIGNYFVDILSLKNIQALFPTTQILRQRGTECYMSITYFLCFLVDHREISVKTILKVKKRGKSFK